MEIKQLDYQGIKFEGLSLAGVRTSITIPQYSIAFDVAQGLPHTVGMNTFLITHGHMDHAAGIPYIISQKAMNSHKKPRFIMPESMVMPMQEIMKQWMLIEGHQYEYEFIGARVNESFDIQSKLQVTTFKTIHRVPSLGYTISRRSHKLRSDLVGLTSPEIAEVRQRGEDPTEEKIDPIVSFTGDTQIEFLDQSPEVCRSKILIVESTYLDEKKSIESAKEWGHIHLSELIPRLEIIKSEKIILIHSSARYSLEEAETILKKRLPPHERDRIILFSGR